jgi:hypothetical protein
MVAARGVLGGRRLIAVIFVAMGVSVVPKVATPMVRRFNSYLACVCNPWK